MKNETTKDEILKLAYTISLTSDPVVREELKLKLSSLIDNILYPTNA